MQYTIFSLKCRAYAILRYTVTAQRCSMYTYCNYVIMFIDYCIVVRLAAVLPGEVFNAAFASDWL